MNQISDQELALEYQKRFRVPDGKIITSSEIAAKHVTAFLGEGISEREKFLLLLLNGKNQLLETTILFEGCLTASAVYPGQVAKVALQGNAAALIVAHNHPSGNLNPSAEDRNLTERLKAALKTVEVNLHDHVIVVPGGNYYSFADAGIL